MTTSFDTGVMTSWTNTPWLCWLPPAKRLVITVAPRVASSTSSWLSPSTQRQSAPAVKKCFPASPFDHVTIPPTPVTGTVWFSVIRPTLRRTVTAGGAGTARKLLKKVSKSVKRRAWRSL